MKLQNNFFVNGIEVIPNKKKAYFWQEANHKI